MIKKLLATHSIAALALVLMGAAAPTAIIGKWKTIDDVTGYPKAIVSITETPNHTLAGTIMETFVVPGIPPHDTCTACVGDKHNKPIIGMTILSGLKADPNVKGRFMGGDILDPHNGKTYHCTLQLTDHDQKLNVRGYIGLPLFGRTQTWERA